MEETKEELLRRLEEVVKTSINVGHSTASRHHTPNNLQQTKAKQQADDTLDGTSKIWLIGDIGGGLKYFSNDLMIGLARELSDQATEGKAPDHIIFDGGIYPVIQRRISKRGRDKALAIINNINSLEDARESVKPHMTRIADVIEAHKLSTTVHYILGPNDEENITSAYEWIAEIYNYTPAVIAKMIRVYEERTRNNEKTITEREIQKISLDDEIELAKSQLKTINDQFANLEQLKRLDYEGTAKLESELTKFKDSTNKKIDAIRRSLQGVERDISKAKQELPDYCRIADLYKELRRLWIRENAGADADRIFETFGQFGEMDEQIAEEMVMARPDKGISEVHNWAFKETGRLTEEMLKYEKGSEAYANLDRKFKLAEKLMRSTSTAYAEHIRERAHQEIAQQQKETAIFSGNFAGSPDLARIADQISRDEMLVAIKNAFGRRMNLELATKNLKTIRMDNITIDLTNRPKNTSFNFTKDNDTELRRLSMMIRTDEENTGRFRLILGAHSSNGRVFYMPEQNKSERFVCVVTAPFLMDIPKIQDAFNNKRKDRVTEAYHKHMASSGFFEIKFNNVTSSHAFISSDYLKMKADQEKEDEVKRSIRILQEFNPIKVDRSRITNADIIEAGSKMFSELSTELSNKLLLMNGIDPHDQAARASIIEFLKGRAKPEQQNAIEGWFSSNVKPAGHSRKAETLDIVCISDAHVGGSGKGKYSPQAMLRGVTSYVAAHIGSKPFLLFLGGDNYEGGENHPWKHATNNQILPENIELFAHWLHRNGVTQGSLGFYKTMHEFSQMIGECMPIQNVNKQVDVFIKCIENVIKSAEAVAIASGNHPNKRTKGQMDESLTLKMVIDRIVGHKRSENVLATAGEDVGMMDITVDYFKVHVAHKLARNFVKRVNPEQTLILSGDRHEYSLDVVDNKVVIVAPPLALQGTYVDEKGIKNSDSLRGFARLEVTYGKGNTILKVKGQLIAKQELEERGMLKQDPSIELFLNDKYSSIKMRKRVTNFAT